MIIDFHNHCFPDWLAERACGMLIRNSGMVTPFHDGTVAGAAAEPPTAELMSPSC